jgi:hypothetical protein
MIIGIISKGNTSAQILLTDSMNGISARSDIRDKNSGASIAKVQLLSSEYDTNREILPPSIPVMTGAAVAVDINTHINAPWPIYGFIHAVTK